MSAAVPPARIVCAAAVCAAAFSCFSIPSLSADAVPQPMAATGFAGMLQVLFGLGLVLGIIAGTAWLLKRLSPGQVASSGFIRVIGGVAVGPKERVVLVDVGERRLVLGVAPGQVNLLLEMQRPAADPAVSPAVEAGGGKFYARLKEIMRAGSGKDGPDDAR